MEQIGWSQTSLARAFKKCTGAALDEHQGYDLALHTVGRMFGYYNKIHFKHLLLDFVNDHQTTGAYSDLVHSHHVFWDVKLWLYYCFRHGYGHNQGLDIAPRFAVIDRNKRLIEILKDDMFNSILALHTAKGYKARERNEMNELIATMCVERKGWGYNEAKPLRYLDRNPHSGLTLDGMVQDCFINAIESVRDVYPLFDSDGHIKAIFHKGFKWKVNSILTLNRNKVVQDDGRGGAQSVVIGFPHDEQGNLIETIEMGVEPDYEPGLLNDVLSRLAGNDRKIGELLLGIRSKPFSEYIKAVQPKAACYDDNEEAFHAMKTARYRKLLKGYLEGLGIVDPAARMDSIIDRIRNMVYLRENPNN